MKKTCQYCGDVFAPIRNTKKFCVDSCRTLYSIHQCSKAERFIGDKRIATHLKDYQAFAVGKSGKNLTIRQWFALVTDELEQFHICKKNTTPPYRRELRKVLELAGKSLGESYIPYIA